MGVLHLWKILDEMELAEKKDLSFLCGKRVAVDLSGWVVQAQTCPGLNKSKNPHLRNLFFRAIRLLKNGVFPIFILEGKVPTLKKDTFQNRNHQGHSQGDNVARSRFDTVLKECEKFLLSFGLPCIKSSGEAEALCAFLYKEKIVDGVISQDGDAFLYGADTVLRDYSGDEKNPYVKEYCLKSPKNTLKLDQEKLIALALLLGCDYNNGVQTIGRETAVKLIGELQGHNLIQRFKDWKLKSETDLFQGYDPTVKKEIHCKQCSHSGSFYDHKNSGCKMCDSKIECYSSDGNNPCLCVWHSTQEVKMKRKIELKVYNASKRQKDFPNQKVVEEFLNFKDPIPDDNCLEWRCPNLKEFQKKTEYYFNWTYENSFENCFPLITLWQQFKLYKEPQTTEEELLYKPIKILKQRTKNHIKCFEVQWNHIKDDGTNHTSEELCALEIEEVFIKAYPKLCEDFYNTLKKPKNDPKSPKNKSPKSKKGDKKMTQFFPVIKNITIMESPDVKSPPAKREIGENSDETGQNLKKLCVSENDGLEKVLI